MQKKSPPDTVIKANKNSIQIELSEFKWKMQIWYNFIFNVFRFRIEKVPNYYREKLWLLRWGNQKKNEKKK